MLCLSQWFPGCQSDMSLRTLIYTAVQVLPPKEIRTRSEAYLKCPSENSIKEGEHAERGPPCTDSPPRLVRVSSL